MPCYGFSSFIQDPTPIIAHSLGIIFTPSSSPCLSAGHLYGNLHQTGLVANSNQENSKDDSLTLAAQVNLVVNCIFSLGHVIITT